MFSLRYIVLCFGILAAVLKSTHALSDDEKLKIKESLMPAFTECGSQYNTDKAAVEEAKKKGQFDSIDKCFFACMFKKSGFMTDKGLFDPKEAVAKVQKHLSDDADKNNLTELSNICAEVNAKEVSDGDEGCERAKLLFGCFHEHKEKFHLH